MEAKHTSGPWSIQRSTLHPHIRLVVNPPENEASPIEVCHIDGHALADTANANLIAAAPELLAALEEAKVLLTYCADGDEMSNDGVWDEERLEQAILMAKQAIAKAKGE
jgi:hypothetical protein